MKSAAKQLMVFVLTGLLVVMPCTGITCTTTITTAGASADGTVMVSHSDDNHQSDSSVNYVASIKIDPKKDRRNVYPSAVAIDNLPEYNAFFVPTMSVNDRGPTRKVIGAPVTKAIGTIPRDFPGIIPAIQRTYAYLDASYGIVNEHGVMFGECTNGGKASHNPMPGKRIFYSSELARVALEHTKTARDAVKLIGHLIDTYGYYGTGETLPVADAIEAWVIEMAPVPEDATNLPVNGLWVAQQVPDGEFFVAANEFRIREIDPARRDKTQMYGDQLFDTTKALGWHTASDKNPQLMDWLPTVSLGEYSHPYYSLRRVWRALSLAAPSRNLSAWVQDGKDGLTRDYPFSVKPDYKLTLADLKKIHRDHYEGTEFDMTQTPGSGPFNNPNRYLEPCDPSGDVGNPNTKLLGAWERPIGAYYTNLTFISQVDPKLPYPLNVISWIALDSPAESVFVPLAVAPVPPAYARFDPTVFALNEQAWRVYNLVGEYANLQYSYMIKDIASKAAAYESTSTQLLKKTQRNLSALAAKDPAKALAQFNKILNDNAGTVHKNWIELFGHLALTYNQGMINKFTSDKPWTTKATKATYSEKWLRTTEYFHGPTDYKQRPASEREPTK